MTLHLKEDQLEFLEERRLKVRDLTSDKIAGGVTYSFVNLHRGCAT